MNEEEYIQLDARSNINSFYSFLIAKAFCKLGGEEVIICPGSRNTPLVCAFANTDGINCSSVLDERSASFFALGLAIRTNKPVAVVCTSGSAVANFLPAVVEAHYSRVPLMIFSADRPPELRNCFSGQTIRQENIFGDYVDRFVEMPLPQASPSCFEKALSDFTDSFSRASHGLPVHLNFPFRDPLVPEKSVDPELEQFDLGSFLEKVEVPLLESNYLDQVEIEELSKEWESIQNGLIIAGSGIDLPDAKAVEQLSISLGWPILADAISSLRGNCPETKVITAYDAILRKSDFSERLRPDGIIVLGPLPTSKVLRQWLEGISVPLWMIDSRPVDISANILKGERLYHEVSDLLPLKVEARASSDYGKLWHELDQMFRKKWEGHKFLQNDDQEICEPIIPFLLSSYLPNKANIMVANSTPVRDLEFFWPSNKQGQRIFCNRGANGIDGTLSTAMGIAHKANDYTYLVTGDLALLHDSNGFLIQSELVGNLTIILLNNQGGGIFSLLPISERSEFEKYFQTTQSVDWSNLALGWNVDHFVVQRAKELRLALEVKDFSGIRILEIPCSTASGKKLRADLLHTDIS